MIQTDGLKVSRDEALELAVHHAVLASCFFEAAPDPFSHEEVLRILEERDICIPLNSIKRFFLDLDAAYNEAKTRD